jgi:hypothetical protein
MDNLMQIQGSGKRLNPQQVRLGGTTVLALELHQSKWAGIEWSGER